MIIEVTREDINKGIKRNACHCPIARAIARHTGSQCAIGGDIYLSNSGKSCFIPEIAQIFISRFDAGEPVKPFKFDLPIS